MKRNTENLFNITRKVRIIAQAFLIFITRYTPVHGGETFLVGRHGCIHVANHADDSISQGARGEFLGKI